MLTRVHSDRYFLAMLFIAASVFISGCAVYTVDQAHLEKKLKPIFASVKHKGLGLNKVIALSKTQYNNRIDTLLCLDKTGEIQPRKLKYDSRVTIITTSNKSIHFYAKTLFIWNEEFLIGERTTINLRRSNCFSVKLKDIARIEVKG
ncbi:MAG: hypothetical protein V4635_18080 [Bacteroidota bacterium]